MDKSDIHFLAAALIFALFLRGVRIHWDETNKYLDGIERRLILMEVRHGR